MKDRFTVNDLLDEARNRLVRVSAQLARERVATGALVVDTRQHIDRVRDGVIAGSVWIPSTVTLWACDPASGYMNPAISGFDQELIVMCNEGYSSSVAAANLQRLGYVNATDMIGGHEAWRNAGLPSQAPVPIDHSVLDGRWPPEPIV